MKDFQMMPVDQIRSNPQNYVQMLVRHLDRIGENHKIMEGKNLSKEAIYSLYAKILFFHTLTVPRIPEGSDEEKEINELVVSLEKLNNRHTSYELVIDLFKWLEKLLRQWSKELMPPKYITVKMGVPDE